MVPIFQDGIAYHRPTHMVIGGGYVPSPLQRMAALGVNVPWYYDAGNTPANQRSVVPAVTDSYFPPVITVVHDR